MQRAVDIVQSSDEIQSHEFVLQDPGDTSDHACTLTTSCQCMPSTAVLSTAGKERDHSVSDVSIGNHGTEALCSKWGTGQGIIHSLSGNLRAAHCTPETDSSSRTSGGNLVLQLTAQLMTLKSGGFSYHFWL